MGREPVSLRQLSGPEEPLLVGQDEEDVVRSTAGCATRRRARFRVCKGGIGRIASRTQTDRCRTRNPQEVTPGDRRAGITILFHAFPCLLWMLFAISGARKCNHICGA